MEASLKVFLVLDLQEIDFIVDYLMAFLGELGGVKTLDLLIWDHLMNMHVDGAASIGGWPS